MSITPELIGYLMIALPFVVHFIYVWYKHDLRTIVIVYAIVAALLGFLFTAFSLIHHGVLPI